MQLVENIRLEFHRTFVTFIKTSWKNTAKKSGISWRRRASGSRYLGRKAYHPQYSLCQKEWPIPLRHRCMWQTSEMCSTTGLGRREHSRQIKNWSRNLTEQEINPDTTHRESSVLVRPITLLRPCPKWARGTLSTDHDAPRWMVNLADTTDELVHWRLQLMKFWFSNRPYGWDQA